MLKKIFHDSFENFGDLYGKPCKRDSMAKVVFLIQMLPTFGGSSLLLRYTAENSQVTYFQYARSACANKIFQK